MKLNRKGYMLVEIVLASVLAMTIGYYLLNLTYKFKNTSDDVYQSYLYTQDKLLVTKNIMSDLDTGIVSNVVETNINTSTESGKAVEFNFHSKDVDFFETHVMAVVEKRKLMVTKNKTTGITKIRYGMLDSITGQYDLNDFSYYEKELEKTLIIGDLKVKNEAASDNVTFIIPAKSLYEDKDYSIKLFAIKDTRPT